MTSALACLWSVATSAGVPATGHTGASWWEVAACVVACLIAGATVGWAVAWKIYRMRQGPGDTRGIAGSPDGPPPKDLAAVVDLLQQADQFLGSQDDEWVAKARRALQAITECVRYKMAVENAREKRGDRENALRKLRDTNLADWRRVMADMAQLVNLRVLVDEALRIAHSASQEGPTGGSLAVTAGEVAKTLRGMLAS